MKNLGGYAIVKLNGVEVIMPTTVGKILGDKYFSKNIMYNYRDQLIEGVDYMTTSIKELTCETGLKGNPKFKVVVYTKNGLLKLDEVTDHKYSDEFSKLLLYFSKEDTILDNGNYRTIVDSIDKM